MAKYVTSENGLSNKSKFIFDGQKEIGSDTQGDTILELGILGSAQNAERGAAIALEINHQIYLPIHLRDEVMQILTRDHRNKVNLIPHSFGGAVTYHTVNMLPKVLKERVMVHAFAPAKICTPGLAEVVENYVSTRDFVPYLDFKNKENRKYLKILPADEKAPFSDHAFQSPTFKETLLNLLDIYY